MAKMMLRVAAIAAVFLSMAMAANYDVGWELNNSFQAWANNIAFMTGDTITFVYGSTQSVLEVAKTDFDSCQTNASISSDSSGRTVISLNSIGNRYFISGTPTYCDRGMKVVITTVAAPAPPPGTTTPSAPPPEATPTPSSPAPGTPTPSAPPPEATPTPSSPAPGSVSSPPAKTPPSKSPTTAPSKSPASSPPLPASESPAGPPDSEPSAAHKVAGCATGLGFMIIMLLTL